MMLSRCGSCKEWMNEDRFDLRKSGRPMSLCRLCLNMKKNQKFRDFKDTLKLLDFHSYSEYLKSEYWSATKQRYEADSRMLKVCVVCDDPKYILHHRTYARFSIERITDLVPLCAKCHAAVHENEKQRGIDINGVRRVIRARRPELSVKEISDRLAVYREQRKDDRKQKEREKKLRRSLVMA